MLKNITTITVTLLMCLNSWANVMPTSLREAVKMNYVKVKAVSNGGYIGKCLSLQVQNNTGNALNLTVDDALIFQPADEKYQKLVTAGGEMLALNANEEKTISVQTFCGKSRACSPPKKMNFKFEKQGNKEMCEVVKYIREHKLYNGLGQSAVWMFTSGHCLTSVFNCQNHRQSKEFVKFIATTINQPIPEYHVKYKIGTDTALAVFSDELEEAYIDISWNFTAPRNLHIAIFREDGRLYREVHDTENISADGHTVLVKFLASEFKKGKYIVRLYDDENYTYIKKSITFGKGYCL